MLESELKFRTLFEQAAVGVAEVDTRTGRYLSVNQKYCDIVGYSRDELLQRGFASITHPDDLTADLGLLDDLIAGRIREYSMQKRYIRPDGSIVWAELAVSPMWGPGDPPSTQIAVIQDITARKAAEQALHDTNQQLQAINHVVAVCTASLDLQTILDRLLDESLALTGLEGGTICLVDPDRTLRLVAHRGTSEALVADLSSRRVEIGECLCGNCARDHRPLILRDRCAVAAYATREVTLNEQIGFHAAFPMITRERCVGVLCIFTRTERKPAERTLKLLETVTGQIALAVQNAELFRDLTAELAERRRAEEAERTARAQAEAAAHAKDTFLAMVSHELRAPLTSIQAAVDLLQGGRESDPATEELLQTIRDGVTAESRLIADLLDLTRMGTGGLKLQRQPVDIVAAINQAVAAHQPTATAKQVSIVVQCPCADPHVNADPIRLAQILGNLIGNATKFTPADGTVCVRCGSPADGRLVVEVEDSGIGMDEATLARLFQPFEQADASVTRRFGGMGLGLYIAKLLAELHGGHLTARSAGPGKGSVFRVDLPASERPVAAPVPPVTQATGASQRSVRVLLVEDNTVSRNLFKRLLESRGHHVLPAADAEAALAIAAEQAVDVVVSDLGLPGVSGWEMMRQLTATRPIPGIAISGFGAEEDIQRSREAGFSEHLVKPVNMSRLASLINELAGITSAAPTPR